MAGPPANVWVEVATELLAELNDWSEPVQVKITDHRPTGQVEMVMRSTDAPGTDLAEALALLAESALDPEQLSRCTGPDCCWDSRANALLVRHGIRESEAHPGSTLIAWGLHEVDPDGLWEA